MIVESQKLKNILDPLLHLDLSFPSLNLEISRTDEILLIAVNYNDDYYISYTLKQENYDTDSEYLVVPKKGVEKLYQLLLLWPKSSIKICKSNGLILLEVVDHGQLIREKPVYVECFFEPVVNEYLIEAPPMNYSCIVNTKNLKQMLEFCNGSTGVYLEIKDKSLCVVSEDNSLATLVELEELLEKPSKKIKLSTEAINLTIACLNKFISRYNLVYLLFIEHETAFSIKIIVDEFTTVQIYTIHE